MGEVRVKSRIGEANMERILDAALSVFSRYGFRGARTDQIAQAAGMSKPNLLYYFKSKEELYVAVLERTLTMWLDPLSQIDPEEDPRRALTRYIANKLASARDNPAESRLFATEVIQGAPMLEAALKRDLRPIVAEKVSILERWIAEGRMAKVEPVSLLFLIWATTQHYADFQVQVGLLTGRSLDDPEFFAATLGSICQIVLDGILPRAET